MPVGPHLEDRIEFLRTVPALDGLSPSALESLGARFSEERHTAGAVPIREGEAGDRLSVIVEGRAEVTQPGKSGPNVLALLGPRDLFGEIALVSQARRRIATVSARTELWLLSLPAPDFEELARGHPEWAAALHAAAERMLTMNFLRRATPFSGLTPDQARRLADRVERRTLGAGTLLMRQGEREDRCYVLRSGRASVLHQAEGGERELAVVGPGDLIGELALLTDAPRNASVRILEPSEVLAIQRSDLLLTMAGNRELSRSVSDLLQLRSRPRRAPDVSFHEQRTAEGETLTVLRHEKRSAYFRLSGEGRFLWERLDGQATLPELARAYYRECGVFAPWALAELLSRLAAAGFVEGSRLSAAAQETVLARSRTERMLQSARRFVDWRKTWTGIDDQLTAVYGAGGRLLFGLPALACQALVAVAGLIAFGLATGPAARELLRANPLVLLWLLPMNALAILLHEMAHGLATKHFGRTVRGAGIGWYWFGPVAFVDTSDMWLAEKRPRLVVALAGIWLNLVLGGLFALGAAAGGSGLARLICWQLAASNYYGVLQNLNPLMQYDGYYALSDILGRPNLRRDALSWIASGLGDALRRPAQLWRHRLELCFGLGSIAYVAACVVLTLLLSRTFLEEPLARHLPRALASGISWLLAGLVAVSASLGSWRSSG